MMPPVSVLISTSEIELGRRLEGHLSAEGLAAADLSDQATLLRRLESEDGELAVIGGAALALIAALRPRRPTLPVILIARRSTEALTIDALRLGVNDYFKIPFDHPDLLTTIRRHLPSPIASQPAAGFNPRFGRRVQGLTSEALACLMVNDWPSNVRELRNLIEATFINLPPDRTAFMNLPAPFRRQMDALEAQSAATPEECRGVVSALIAADWNKSRAAQRLKWSRMTLYRKIEKYRIVQNRRPKG